MGDLSDIWAHVLSKLSVMEVNGQEIVLCMRGVSRDTEAKTDKESFTGNHLLRNTIKARVFLLQTSTIIFFSSVKMIP